MQTDHHAAPDNGARPLAGVRPDGTPLYTCLTCKRVLAKGSFAHDSNGTPHQMCQACEAKQALTTPQVKVNLKRRSFVTVDEKACADCGQVKPATEFYADRVYQDGLQRRCKPCTQKRQALLRSARGADEPTQKYNKMSTEEVTAILDQAIAERDAAVEALKQAPQTASLNATASTEPPWQAVDIERDQEFDEIVMRLGQIEERTMRAIKELSLTMDERRSADPRPNGLGWAASLIRPLTKAMADATHRLDDWAGTHER